MSTDKASPKNITMVSNRAMLNIMFSIFVVVLELCAPIFPLSYLVFLRLYTLFLYLIAASGKEAVPTESISTSEKSEAAVVTDEIVQASDESKESLIDTKYDEFHGLDDLQYYINNRFLFKITYGYTVKRFVAQIVNGTFAFDMSRLKGKITYLFNLPIESELELSYLDEHWELITMTDDDDLEDIMTQMTLPFLRLYVRLINNAPTVQVGGGAGLKHAGTSKSTNISKSDSPAESDYDDWLLY